MESSHLVIRLPCQKHKTHPHLVQDGLWGVGILLISKQNFNVCRGKEELGGRREETHCTIAQDLLCTNPPFDQNFISDHQIIYTTVRSCRASLKDNVLLIYFRTCFHCPVQKVGVPWATIFLFNRVTSLSLRWAIIGENSL